MQQLSLYIPGIMGLAFALAAFLSVRHIASHRPQVRSEPAQAEEEPPLPFEAPTLADFTPDVRPQTAYVRARELIQAPH